MKQKVIKYSIFRFLLPVFFISAFMLQISAQKIPLYFESYTTENGLPQSHIGKIVQDKSGFIWLTTWGGLSRFDGSNFVNFKHEISDTNSLPADFLTDIVVDSNNGLWISTLGKGLTYYNQEQNLFFRFYNDRDTSVENLKEIVSLFIDKSNYLWIGSTAGLYRSKKDINLFFNGTAPFKNKLTEYKPTSGEKQNIHCVYEDNENNIWAGSDNGLFKINRKNNSYEQIAFNNQKIRVNDIAEFDKDYLLLGTDKGLFKYNKRTKESENILKSEVFANFNANLKVDKILPDKEGCFWIGTYESGLLYYNPIEAVVYQYVKNTNDEHSIKANRVSALYIDGANTLFISLGGQGLNVAKIRINYFQRFRNEKDKNSISHNEIWGVYAVSNKQVWICTRDGLNKFNPKTGKFEQFFMENRSLAGSSNFLVLAKRDSNRFFLSSLGSGLVSFNTNTRTFEKFDWKWTGNINENFITGFHKKNDTILWLSSYGKGIIEYQQNGKKIREVTGLTNKYIGVMYCDTQGRIWLCSGGSGLHLYDAENDNFTTFSKKEGLNSDYIYCIYEDSDGYLWLGTTSGLTKFDPETYKATPLKTETKVFDEEIYSILEDDKENLWVGTNNGLFKINKHSGHFVNFNVRDGLQSNEFNQHACTKTPDGYMLFGGVNGFNYFHPDSITQSNYKPQVVITAFSLFYKNYKKGDKYNDRILLKNPIEYTDTIELKHNEKVIELNFSALDYYESFEIKYAYRLLGFEENWVNTSAKKRFASYTNLSPGNYIFQLKSTNIDGVWNDKIKQLHILIEPAFWQTVWFKIASILFIILVLFSIYRRRLVNIRKQNKKLELLVKQKTKELEKSMNALFEQKEKLNETNFELREKQDEITQQAEELIIISEKLRESNITLEKKVESRTKDLNLALLKADDARRLISSFLENMSHEIRTPMNAISGFSQLIAQVDLPTEKMAKYSGIIIKNIDSLLDLISNIMDASKLHAGQYKFAESTFDLNSLFKSIYNKLINEKGLKKEKVNCSLVLPVSDNFMLHSDQNAFMHVIYNLSENALKYTENGSVEFGYKLKSPKVKNIEKRIKGKYKIDAKKNNFELEIFVKDTGPGINEKEQEIIFDLFRKLESSKEKLYRGSGLGLAIVNDLAKKMHAKIKLESKVNSGTYISLTIPLSEL